MLSAPLFVLICICPLLLSAVGLFLLRRFRGEHRRRKPFRKEEKGLRWPGYSLQKEVEEVGDKIDALLLMLVAGPLMLLGGYAVAVQAHGDSMSLRMIFLIPALIFCGWIVVRLYTHAGLSQRKRLGLLGEQMVGELLNNLMRDGYYVFHDFPRTGWNIDHIVIGETGIFCIETKARRKQIGSGDDADYEMTCDGASIHFVKRNHREAKPIHQARRSARELERFIEERARLTVPVTPVLTFPGWLVKSTAADIDVVNPKQIRGMVLGRVRGRLPKDVVERIAAVIDRECRDVEW